MAACAARSACVASVMRIQRTMGEARIWSNVFVRGSVGELRILIVGGGWKTALGVGGKFGQGRGGWKVVEVCLRGTGCVGQKGKTKAAFIGLKAKGLMRDWL